MLQVSFQPFPEIATTRLLLRAISKNDVTEMLHLRSNENIMRFIDRPRAATKEDALNFINIIANALTGNEGITWGITLKNDPKLIGTIGFWRMVKEHHRAEIGYMLSDLFHRKGIMQEAMTAVLRYGFDVMQLHSVEANVNPANNASQKLLEKNSFMLEAHFKENYYYNGRFLDSFVYSLLAKNYQAAV